MKITIGSEQYEYQVEGDSFTDQPRRLIDRDDDLSKDTDWHEKGYTVEQLFDDTTYLDFHQTITQVLIDKLNTADIAISRDDLSTYHTHLNNYDQHLEVIEKTKLIEGTEIDVFFDKIETRVSQICGAPVQSIKPMNGERVFHFRIIRPNQKDFNPLHKDGWMDELKDCINLYIPICGSNERSSLILAEGSHLLSENTFIRTKQGAKMNGIQFNVPGLIASNADLNFIKPNPKLNEILVFSPYLIHGGAMNLNTDQTRISLEMRFWRKR